MRKIIFSILLSRSSLRRVFGQNDKADAVSSADDESHRHRFRFRRRFMESFAQRRRCRTFDERRRQRIEPDIFARRQLDCFYRRIRRQRRRFRHSGKGGEPRAITYHPGNDRLSAGRPTENPSFSVESRVGNARAENVHDARERAKVCRPNCRFRWRAAGRRFRRTERASLICRSRRLFSSGKNIAADGRRKSGSEIYPIRRRRNSAPELERFHAALDGRQDLFSFRPQRRQRNALFLRHENEKSGASDQ
jgi:hypothetical protein